MTTVQVRLFAQLREQFGVGELSLKLAQPGDIPTLLAALDQHFAQLPDDLRGQLAADNVRIAVNQHLIEGNQTLSEGDEIAFLPPVTGG